MARIKKTKKGIKYDPSKIFGVVDSSVPDFSKDPYFIKKAEQAKKILEKYPIPKEFL
jgi:hypothetical protein